MQRTSRRMLLGVLLVSAISLALTPASASTAQAGLSIKKSRYVMDGGGQVWLKVQLLNGGSQPIRILGLAPAKAGPWTTVGQSAAPGEAIRTSMKVKENAAVLWVDSSQGILRFELTPKR